MHKQEELGKVSDPSGKRDQNSQGKATSFIFDVVYSIISICSLKLSFYLQRTNISCLFSPGTKT